MARLIYGMMQSVDGYVSNPEEGPELPELEDELHAYFNAEMARVAGSLYGRRMYEMMRYWDEPQDPDNVIDVGFATAFQSKPKWVVSRTLKTVGPNATLIASDVEGAVRRLKAEIDGDIEVAGPELAGSLAALGLIDEFQLYVRPVVVGSGGRPFFVGVRPALRFKSSETIAGTTVKLVYEAA